MHAPSSLAPFPPIYCMRLTQHATQDSVLGQLDTFKDSEQGKQLQMIMTGAASNLHTHFENLFGAASSEDPQESLKKVHHWCPM